MSERGEKGDPGEKGEPGAAGPFPRSVTRSFILLVAVAFAVVAAAFYVAEKARDASHDAKSTANTAQSLAATVAQQAATIRQLRAAQAASCMNFTILKGAVNRFHGTIRTFLVQARGRNQKIVDHPEGVAPVQIEAAKLAIAQLNKLIDSTATVKANCAQKPIKAHPLPSPQKKRTVTPQS